MEYLTSRRATKKCLLITTDIVNIVLPPILIDVDIYKNKGEDKYLDINKIVHSDYPISAYRLSPSSKLHITLDYNHKIDRSIARLHNKDNKIVVEYQDLFIVMSIPTFISYFKDKKELIIPDNLDYELDRTYNSKLVIILKED